MTALQALLLVVIFAIFPKTNAYRYAAKSILSCGRWAMYLFGTWSCPDGVAGSQVSSSGHLIRSGVRFSLWWAIFKGHHLHHSWSIGWALQHTKNVVEMVCYLWVHLEFSSLFIRDIHQGQRVRMYLVWRGRVLPHADPRVELVLSAGLSVSKVHKHYVFIILSAGICVTGRRHTWVHCGKTGFSYRSFWSETYGECCPVKRHLILDRILSVWIMKWCETKKSLSRDWRNVEVCVEISHVSSAFHVRLRSTGKCF